MAHVPNLKRKPGKAQWVMRIASTHISISQETLSGRHESQGVLVLNDIENLAGFAFFTNQQLTIGVRARIELQGALGLKPSSMEGDIVYCVLRDSNSHIISNGQMNYRAGIRVAPESISVLQQLKEYSEKKTTPGVKLPVKS